PAPKPAAAGAAAPAPPSAAANPRADLLTAAVVAGLVVVIGLLRYLGPVCCLTPARPPALLPVLGALALVGAVAAALWRLPAGRRGCLLALVGLVALLVVLKT